MAKTKVYRTVGATNNALAYKLLEGKRDSGVIDKNDAISFFENKIEKENCSPHDEACYVMAITALQQLN